MSILIAVLLAAFALPAGAAPDGFLRVERLAGEGRVATAARVARFAQARECSEPDSDGCRAYGQVALLARADAYPDALAAAPLALALQAPLLLTEGTALSPEAAEEIEHLGTRDVIVLGGPGAVSEEVVRQLEADDIQVARIGGATRFDTAADIADRLGDELGTSPDAAVVVEGVDPDSSRGWPDALSAAGPAAAAGTPILLTGTDVLPVATAEAIRDLGITDVTVVGGPAAVSDAVLEQLREQAGTAQRLSGSDRYETSRVAAEAAIAAGANVETVWLATGRAFPDALAAGPAVAASGGVLLLLEGDPVTLHPAPGDFLRTHTEGIRQLVVLGGLQAVDERLEGLARLAAGMCDFYDYPYDVGLGAAFMAPVDSGGDLEPGAGEYMVVCNSTDAVIDLAGWYIENKAGERIALADGYFAYPHRAFFVHTGPGESNMHRYFAGRDQEFMPNNRGFVILHAADGAAIVGVAWDVCRVDDCG